MLFKKSNKLFVHIDCDSFFASCEVFRNPKLKGKKVCVGNEIVIACTYEAKALGVKTGTPVWEARKILGNSGIFLGLDHEFYSLISDRLMSYLQENMLSVEQFSIDEAFCEISGLPEMYKMTEEKYLKKLQKDVLEIVGVPVSIGCANTRIKAKIFSKLNKPFGIYIGYDKEQEFELFKTMPLKLIPFIGKSSQEKLKFKAITIYDFIHLGFWEIKKIFGKNGTDLWLELMGVNAFVVKKSLVAKSISRTRSFNNTKTNDKEFLLKQILYNFDNVFETITDKNLEIKNISIMLRDKDFCVYYFSHKLASYTNLRKDLLSIVLNLFESNFDSEKIYRSTGVVISEFRSYLPRQISIFDNAYHSKDNDYKLTKIVNSINQKYGNHKVSFGVVSLGKKDEAKLYIRA